MRWRFTLIESDDTRAVIEEPVFWNELSMVLQRDPDMHGMYYNFSANSLQFHGNAYFLIKGEYDINGVDAYIGILVEWMCDACDEEQFEPFFQGKLDFSRYREFDGPDCYIQCALEDDTPQTLLKNRGDISVDLLNNKAYDNETILTDYAGLNKEITIPSKALLLQAEATLTNSEEDTGYSLITDFDFDPSVSNGIQYGIILPKLNQVNINEIDDFNPSYQFDFYGGWDSDAFSSHLSVLDGIEILSIKPLSVGDFTNTYEITYRIKGRIYINFSSEPPVPPPDGPGVSSLAIGWELKVGAKYGASKADAFTPISIATYSDISINEDLKEETVTFDQSGTFTVTLNDNEKLWFYLPFNIIGAKDAFSSLPPLASVHQLIIYGDVDSMFKSSSNNLRPDTPCTTFMIHEAASRVIESITNNELKFKSEYFGRVDSEPYAFDQDGCGGLRTITNGLQLRRAVLQDNTAPKVFTTWNVLRESLNAIDCIGVGMEGSNVRAEPVKFFYQNTIIFIADGVNEITTIPRTDRIWNKFNFGYDKFETESTNGLDAIHTKREYRIPIQNTDASLEKTSKYIADAYAIEVTRRKFGTTEDWRYDQDIFMFCLKRGEEDVEVEQGNINNAASLFDPATETNYRISPIRNAMRWFHWVMQGIRTILSSTQMLFSSGVGNYVAEGELSDEDCKLEAGVVAEDEALSINTFDDSDDARPFIVPETITFTYPLGLNEFVHIKENFYGLIQFRKNSNREWQYGWIDKLEPAHQDGDAKFTLIPAIVSSEELTHYIITEDGRIITDEGGTGLITED